MTVVGNLHHLPDTKEEKYNETEANAVHILLQVRSILVNVYSDQHRRRR